MRRLLALAAALLLCAAPTGGKARPAPAPGPGAPRFVAVDLYVDSGERKLAAYQLEITYQTRVKVLSLEGGEPAAFSAAPHYDPAGMTGGRIVIAAFTTDDENAPEGRNRVARLHLWVEGGGAPELTARLMVAARPGGEHIEAKVEVAQAGESKEKMK